MRFFKIVVTSFLLLLLSMQSLAQEHLANSVSVSPVTPLNGRGFVLTIQYHINSFDEFRGGFFLRESSYSDSLSYAVSLLTLDYAKGFKFRKEGLSKFGYYLGIGLFTGKEETLTDTTVGTKQTIYGLRSFLELEWGAIPQLTLITRIGRTFAFTDKASTNLELVLGTRLYF